MIKLGLTGSIGMGKSEAAAAFRALDIPVFDSDAEVHNILEEDKAAIEEIGRAFPGAVQHGRVDRGKLGSEVFGNQEKLNALEKIIHPRVQARRIAFVDNGSKLEAPMVVFDIPLLFETGAEVECDKVLVISAPADVQRRRVLAREGMTKGKLEAVLSHQMSDAEKRQRADFVISGAGGIEVLHKDIARLAAELIK